MASHHHEDVVEYYDQFVHAIKRTEAWQLNPGDITMDRSVRYVNEQSEKELVELYNKYITELPEERRYCCISVSYYLVDLVSEYFSTDAYLTIGNVHDYESIFYECSEEYLYNLMHDENMDRSKLKVHAWITLSSGEIVDFTFFKGRAKRFDRWKILADKIVAGEPDKTVLNLNYVPFVVGHDYLVKAGAIGSPAL